MEYKYIIHLSEDLEKHEETVRKILAFDDSFKGTEEEHLVLCEELFTFKRFLHPGHAIEFYNKENIIPDLKIQDIDFTELKPKDAPSKYRENISGIYEIEYLLNRIEELEKKGVERKCFIIPFTGKLDDGVIVQALYKVGWESKTIGKVKKITDSRLMKDDQVQLKLRIKDHLKEVACSYFSKLNDGERMRLEITANGDNHANWKKYKVQFENYDFPLRKMLIGYGDIDKMKPMEINDIIKDLLNKSNPAVEFIGWWKDGEVCNKMLKEYWRKPNHPQLKRNVNLRAIDVTLEIMKIIEDVDLANENSIPLSDKNQLYNVGHKPKGTERERIFSDKLAARRVAIALSRLFFDYESDKLTLDIACSLITRGNTSGVEVLEDLMGPTMSIYLGLKRNENKVIIHRETLMTEELDFVNEYVLNVKSLRAFLNEFDPKPSTLNGFKNVLDELNDLSAFNEFIYEFQKQKPGKLNQLIKETKDILMDEKFKGAEKIIALSNSLFL